MMNPKSCPQCGTPLAAEAPEGLCRSCLLKLALEPNSFPSTGAEFSVDWTPPQPQELSARFPSLDILELLGRGGMGAVYKGRQKELDRLVAVKILPPGIGADPSFAERFAREAKALAKLNHPSIVTIHEFGQTNGLFYFVMEYVDGVNLRQLLDGGRIAPREALTIVPQICDALQYAHDQGVVHRDIKPENILLDRRGRVKVADFGIAKIMGREPSSQSAVAPTESPSTHNTEANRVVGTPHYMAPEQVARPGDVDHRADIYSLGVVFYQMLTGELPAKQIEPPSKKVIIDVRLDEVVLRAMEQDPARRYQHVSQVKTQVETISQSSPHPGVELRTALRAPLKVSGRSYFTTPEHLTTFFGGFWWPREAGELALHDDQLILSRGWQRTEIPFATLHEVGLARCPRWMSPAGHQFLSLRYDENGKSKTLLLMPGPSWFRSAADTKRCDAEWITAIRDTVRAATGRELSCRTDKPTVVRASPWGTMLVFAPLLLIMGLCFWQLFVVRGARTLPAMPPVEPPMLTAPLEAPNALRSQATH